MNKHVEKALLLFERRPEMAAKELLAALAEEPDDSYSHALLGLCLMNAKDKDGAFAQVKEAIKLDPESAFAFYALAKCHHDVLNMLDAEVAIDEALRLEPWNTTYWGLLSNIQIEQGELKEALKSAETGLEMSPEDVHCHNLRALLKTKLGQKEEAKHSLDTAMAAAPEDALTHAYRGWALIEHHNHAESIEHFREALRLDPTLEWARQGLVKALQVRHWLFQLQVKLKNGGALAIIAILVAVMYGLPIIFTSPTGLLAQAIGLTVFLCGLGVTFLIILFILLWAIPQVTTPIVHFLLVFDADGRLAMTQEERHFNVHLMAFITAAIIATVYAINFSAWWVLALLVSLYFLTVP
ncbi:MAG: tetratricopeptide repeat protein, partial [Candidatus Melainabacteria bacterium]|nr:tetratricopeptide repeat protein [Candidatus Melainabacteria bacterium]